MFERYTEQARKVVFFARYEASQTGMAEITPQHLLLGILREERELRQRVFGSHDAVESLRNELFPEAPAKRISTSVDLPLSIEGRRVLTYAAEEAEHLTHERIGAEHLLLGIAREESCPAAQALRRRGFDLSKLRVVVFSGATPAAKETPQSAGSDEASLLIGREREVARTLQILTRRTKHHVALIGEPGVGKTAILRALAQRIEAGEAPALLTNRPIVTVDAGGLIASRRRDVFPQGVILCIEGLFDLAAHRSAWAALEGSYVLEPCFTREGMQCIATGTPAGFRQTVEHAGTLARHFEVVEVAPPDEDEALRILAGVKAQYEEFHGVVYASGALEAAIYASGRFLAHRFLPDRAIDLMDEAGARLKLRAESGAGRATVTPDTIAEVVAERAGVSVEAVKQALEQRGTSELRRIVQELAAAAGADGHEWLPLLAGYLVRCPADESAALAEAIRRAKG